MIVIFDNFLVLAHDVDDLYIKLELVLNRCVEDNIKLKLKKSKIGFAEASFFCYVIKDGTYAMSKERISEIDKFIFPSTLKAMQSFLGAINFIAHSSPTIQMLQLAYGI